MRLSLGAAACVALLLVSGVARATPSRVVSLGDLGRYMEDDTNVLLYPSLISTYSHFVYVDLGGPNGVQSSLSEIQTGGLNAGAFVRLGEGFQIGVLTSDFAASEESAFLTNVAAHSDMANSASFLQLAQIQPVRRYDIILGYGSPKDFSAGLRISYGGASDTYTPDPSVKAVDPTNMNNHPARAFDQQSVSQFRLQGGVSFNFGGGTLLDGAIDYTNFGASYLKNDESTFNGGGGNAIGFALRLRVPITRFWTLIPQITYRGWFFNLGEDWTLPAYGASDPTLSVPLDGGHETLTHGMTQNYLDVGIAGELKANKYATFWLAIGLSINSFNTNDSETDTMAKISTADASSALTWGLPYIKFGTEVTPIEWARLRIGVEKYALAFSANVTNTNNNAEAGTPITTNTGASGTAPALDPTVNALFAQYLPQDDFNAYLGASLIPIAGFTVDLLVQNNILEGSFVKGLAGRASVAYHF